MGERSNTEGHSAVIQAAKSLLNISDELSPIQGEVLQDRESTIRSLKDLVNRLLELKHSDGAFSISTPWAERLIELERVLDRARKHLEETIRKVQEEKERERERRRELWATMRSLQRGALRNNDATPTDRKITHDIPPDIPDTLFEADFCSATVAVLRMALTPCPKEHPADPLNLT